MNILKRLVELVTGSGSGNPKANHPKAGKNTTDTKEGTPAGIGTWIYGPGWCKYQGAEGFGLNLGTRYWVQYYTLGAYRVYEAEPTEEMTDHFKVQRNYQRPAEYNREWERCEV